MSRQFRSLLQKEWAERRSTVWYGTILLLAFLGYCLAYETEYRTRAFVASSYHVMHLFGLLGSIFLSMRTVHGEYSERTLKFSAALPIPLSHLAWTRLWGLWLCLIIPMVIGTVVSSVLLGAGLIEQAEFLPHELSLPERNNVSPAFAIGTLWATTAIAIAYAVEVSTLVCWIGTWCRSETTVGFASAVIAPLFVVFTSLRRQLERSGQYLLADWAGALIPNALLISYGFGEMDGSSYADLDFAPLIVGPLAINLCMSLALAWAFTRRYGCHLNTQISAVSRSRKWLGWLPLSAGRIPVFGRSQMSSLAWLALRQSLPLSLCGLMIAVVIALFSLIGEHPSGIIGTVEWLRGAVPADSWYVGILWSSIVGVGVFGAELQPDLERFWRSRPIPVTTWFWIKFFVGLIAVIGALDLIPAAIGWNHQMHPTNERTGIIYLACMPLIHVLVYSLAVATVCHWRRPIPAGIAAIMLWFAFNTIIESIPIESSFDVMKVHQRLVSHHNAGKSFDPFSEGYPVAFGLTLIVVIITTALARRQIVSPVAATRLTLFVAGLTLLFSGRQGFSQENVSVDELIQGMQQRALQIHDLHLKFDWQRHRTDTFYEYRSEVESQERQRRQRQIEKPEPRDEDAVCELFVRSNAIAWTLQNSNGSKRRRLIFDGKSVADYEAGTGGRTKAKASVISASMGTHPPLLTVESGLMQPSQMLSPALSLGSRLRNGKFQFVSDRQIDGERLIDFVFETQTMQQGQPQERLKCSVTMNVTRGFWPIRIRRELFEADALFMVLDVAAKGWLESNGVSYPQQVIQQHFVVPRHQSTSSDSGSVEPSLQESQRIDITECSINQGLTDDVFQPPFPPGTRYWNDQVFYEVDSTGVSHIYVPRPAGIRGATFAYHLIWITGAVAYLFGRRGRHAPA